MARAESTAAAHACRSSATQTATHEVLAYASDSRVSRAHCVGAR